MQAFNDIFGMVSAYKPYYIYVLLVFVLGLIIYFLYKVFYKKEKKENKVPTSVMLREKFATLESIRADKKQFSVFASMLLKELVSYKIGVDLRPLTSKEIEDLFLGLEELKKEQNKDKIDLLQEKDSNRESIVKLDYFETKLFDKNRILNTLEELDRIKYKKHYEDKELKDALFYIKDVLDDILEELLKKKDLIFIKSSEALQSKLVSKEAK